MSTQRSRKRRRSQAFPDENDHNGAITAAGDDSSGQKENGHIGTDNIEKEREVWDAFREEHFEAVEQMPLTLHRQFTLMHELDQQALGYMADLLPTLHKYISQRLNTHATPSSPLQAEPADCTHGPADDSVELKDTHTREQRDSTPMTISPSKVSNGISSLQGSTSPTKVGPSTPLRIVQSESLNTPRTSTPMGVPPERINAPQTTRQMLSHIAWLLEELERASEEKVNLAQAACDSVNRHIRLIQQAIKEQEVSLGVHSGPQPAHRLLPDLVVPRWGRPSRTTLSPIPGVPGGGEGEPSDDRNIGGEQRESEGNLAPGPASIRKPGRPRIHPPRKKGVKEQGPTRSEDQTDQEDSEETPPDNGGSLRRPRSSNLKITLPPLSPGVARPSGRKEPRYCYCNQVSFGQMIGCDGPSCQREWFHLECAGLKGPINSSKKWYCRECTATRGRKRK